MYDCPGGSSFKKDPGEPLRINRHVEAGDVGSHYKAIRIVRGQRLDPFLKRGPAWSRRRRAVLCQGCPPVRTNLIRWAERAFDGWLQRIHQTPEQQDVAGVCSYKRSDGLMASLCREHQVRRLNVVAARKVRARRP